MSSIFAANLFSFIMPVTAAGIVPALLVLAEPKPGLASTPLLVAGSILVVAGLTLLAWTVTLFIRIGRGTGCAMGPHAQTRGYRPFPKSWERYGPSRDECCGISRGRVSAIE